MDYITRVTVLVECVLFTQADNPMAKFFEMTVVRFIFSSLVSWVENPYQEFFSVVFIKFHFSKLVFSH